MKLQAAAELSIKEALVERQMSQVVRVRLLLWPGCVFVLPRWFTCCAEGHGGEKGGGGGTLN